MGLPEHGSERLAGARIEGRERLVEEQHPGRGRERPRQRDALPLAARQAVDAAVEKSRDA
jgi:hypothetical protein